VLRQLRAVLLDVVTEVSLRCMGAGNQYLGNPLHRIAHLAEELVFAAHVAAMLSRAVDMLPNLLRKNLRSVELKDLRCVVIDPGDCMEKRH
jgi:hypothetical protein